MNDINLIPGDYRERLVKERWLRLFGVVSVLLILTILSGYGMLRQLTEALSVTVQELQVKKEVSTRRRQDLERIRARKQELQQQLTLLRGLRSGAAAETMLLTVDRALDGDDVWFLNWTFQRTGVPVGEETGTRSDGFAGRSSEQGSEADGKSWRAQTLMNISGRALDHAALAGFVTRLIGQKEIRDVRVLRTARRADQGNPVVDFELAVAVASRSGNS